ncbi:MAG: lysophospholipid acyltransferase family protein [Verrucomicrobia bacterium]|nr:lysophospholipid acyltransferase family protein [Verrucomicrobiota bacterium]
MDLPELTTWQRWQYHGLRLLLRGLGRLSYTRISRFGAWAGRMFYRLGRSRRNHALQACAEIFSDRPPDAVASIVRSAYEESGRSALESAWAAFSPHGSQLIDSIADEDDTEGLLKRLRDQGRGVLVVTAHVSNFELLFQWAGRFVEGAAVVKALRGKAVNQLMVDLRTRSGLGVLPAHNSYRSCLRLLRENKVVGFIIDQNMIREEGIFVDFFGKLACTTPGLAMMSAQSRSPVLPLFVVRTETGFRIVHGDLIEPPADRSPEQIFHATQTYTKVVEDMVRRYPEQWIWMHNRWRTRPPEGVGPQGTTRRYGPKFSPDARP